MISKPGGSFTLKILYLVLAGLCGESLVFSQQLPGKIEEYNVKNYNESLYILTDRDIYVTGERVWLKVYELNGLAHIPMDISKVAYIELLDKSNSSIRQIKVNIEGNSGSSGFILPDNISSGNYTIRAYTLWMENFSPELYSYKTIAVINPFESLEHLAIPEKNRSADSVMLFPEGGSLIPGRNNRIAVRTYDKDGIPVSVKGALLKNGTDTILNIVTSDNGFGLFNLYPKASESYTFVFNTPQGARRKAPVPGIQKQGPGLRVDYNKDDNSFIVRIISNGEPSAQKTNMNLAVLSSGTVSFLREIETGRDSIISILPDKIPSGYSQILLIDGDGNQKAGRYVFRQEYKRLNLKITAEKSDYAPREKLKINISATDNAGRPLEADLTASVTKSAVVKPAGTMLISLNGSDDYEPDENDYKDAAEINDYLISFPASGIDPNNLMNPEKTIFRYLPELEGHQIRGHIRMKGTDEPLRNTDISLSYVGKAARCQFGKTDDDGGFSFLIKESGFSEIVIQPLSSEITGYYTEINQPFSDVYSSIKPPPFYIEGDKISSLNNVIISMQISNIYEPYTEIKPVVQKNAGYDFFGIPENTIKMSDYIELTTLREVVKEILPNVYTIKQNGKYDFKLINKFRGQPFTNNPLILVDGVPIYDFEKVLNISSKEIEKADILNTRYFFSQLIFDGIVSFVSGKGDLSVLEFDNTIFRQVYEGCQIPENFYSPDYSSDELKNNRIPDFRNTLYWKPDLHTGKDGKTDFEFYSSDESGDYVITVEGIAADGKKGALIIPLVIKAK
jgi:hypothetical protein